MSALELASRRRFHIQGWRARDGIGLVLLLANILRPADPLLASDVVPPLAKLFEAEVLADNVFAVQQRTRSLAPEARYEYLRAWVLPSHSSLRLFAKLTPAEPVPPVPEEHPFDQSRLRIAAERGQRRVLIGGNLVSPVSDFIDTAQQLNRLDELRSEILTLKVSGEIPERGQLSLLALIEMARGDE